MADGLTPQQLDFVETFIGGGPAGEAPDVTALADHFLDGKAEAAKSVDKLRGVLAKSDDPDTVRIADFGLDVVEAYMGHVQDNAAESVREVIDALSDCEYEYPTDTGQVIKVKISVDRKERTATVDFTGTRVSAVQMRSMANSSKSMPPAASSLRRLASVGICAGSAMRRSVRSGARGR